LVLMLVLVVVVLVLVVLLLLLVGLNAHELRRDAGKILVLLLELHPPILEPNLYLPLGEQQVVRYLNAAPPSQVPVIVELLLQFKRLETRIRGPLALRFAHRVDAVWVVGAAKSFVSFPSSLVVVVVLRQLYRLWAVNR